MKKLNTYRHVIAFLILAINYTSACGQAEQKSNSIYLELLGNGMAYSINYDRSIPLNSKIKLAPRLGVEYIPFSDNQVYDSRYKRFHFLIEGNVLYALKDAGSHHLETGLGISFFNMVEGYYMDGDRIVSSKSKMANATMLRLGYRSQKPEGGMMYRVGVLIKLSQDKFSQSIVGDDLFYRLWPGFSIGYSF